LGKIFGGIFWGTRKREDFGVNLGINRVKKSGGNKITGCTRGNMERKEIIGGPEDLFSRRGGFKKKHGDFLQRALF